MKRTVLSSIVRVLISFGLIALLLFVMRQQLGDVASLLVNINIVYVAAAVLLALVSHVFLAMRLKLFLAAQQIAVTIKEAVGLTFIGYFFNNFLPTAVGGDMVKAYYASKKTNGKLHSFTSVLMDRCIGLFSLGVLTLGVFIVLRGEVTHMIMVGPLWIMLGAIILFLLMFFNTWFADMAFSLLSRFRVRGMLGRVYDSFLSFRGQKVLFARTVTVSLLAQGISFVAVFFLIQGLSAHVPFLRVFLIMPFIFFASMFPSINGLGVREGAFVLFFRPLIGADKALALSLLWLFVYAVLGILGGFVYAFARHGKAVSC